MSAQPSGRTYKVLMLGLAAVKVGRGYPFGVAVGVFAGGREALFGEFVVGAAAKGEGR